MNQYFPPDEEMMDDEEIEPSRTEKKRQAEALQKLGMALVELKQEKLNQIPLPDQLRQAIIDAQLMRSHGAMRRQAQFIGKLMRKADSNAILEAYQGLTADAGAQTAAFHEVERWRTRLLSEGATALTEFISTYHPTDIQSLRHHIKKAIDDIEKNRNLGASKALFRYLTGLMV